MEQRRCGETAVLREGLDLSSRYHKLKSFDFAGREAWLMTTWLSQISFQV